MGPNAIQAGASASPVAAGSAFLAMRVGHIFMVRLAVAPTPLALAELAAEVARAREAAGAPLVYVAVVPRDAHAPGPDVRPLMAEFARYVSQVSAEVHLVVEVEGFAGTVLRSAITAVAMISRERNLTVHRALTDALATVGAPLAERDAAQLERAARSLGLLH